MDRTRIASAFHLDFWSQPTDAILVARSLDFELPLPASELRCCVVVPAKNEQDVLPRLIAALADQRSWQGVPLPPSSYEVILLLNNCTDRTAEVARQLQALYPPLQLHFAEIDFSPEEAHVGRARQALFDFAFTRFLKLGRPEGLILTTDADSRPAADWIAQNQAEIAAGAAAVGGRILLEPQDLHSLPTAVRRFVLLDIAYRRALEELRCLYAPDAFDPFPRHHQHFGGSLAIEAAAYGQAGGMPLRDTNEDVAMYRALVEANIPFRHSYRARVWTSARMMGRAHGGLADALCWWDDQAAHSREILVESAEAADRRLAELGRWLWRQREQDFPVTHPPLHLTNTPEPPDPNESAEIHRTIHGLRCRIAALRPLPLERRLQASSPAGRGRARLRSNL